MNDGNGNQPRCVYFCHADFGAGSPFSFSALHSRSFYLFHFSSSPFQRSGLHRWSGYRRCTSSEQVKYSTSVSETLLNSLCSQLSAGSDLNLAIDVSASSTHCSIIHSIPITGIRRWAALPPCFRSRFG